MLVVNVMKKVAEVMEDEVMWEGEGSGGACDRGDGCGNGVD